MIYLASRSPRRLELLKQIGITEVRLLLDEDEGRAEELEAIRPKESPTNYVERVARAKAEAARQRLQELQRQDFLAEMTGSPVAEIAATTAPATATSVAGATSNGTVTPDSPSAASAAAASPAPGKLPKSAGAATGRNWPPAPLLAADTTVAVGGRILGKPTDEEDARRILKLLSGRSHRVLSSVVVVSPRGKVRQRTQVSRVRFRRLTDEDITAYIASGEPFGKAGAYGIQGLAACFVKKIEGSYSSIMGLPLYETATLLKKAGYPPAPKTTPV
ncbi:nucleoside triphosphate pyrophosphatase [Lautropia mirabilis]